MATVKQIKAVQYISQGDSVSRAMLKAGYSKATAKNPDHLTERKGFIELLEIVGITDDKLSTVLNEGLSATKAVVMGKESADSFVDVQPDFMIRHKYLETALKLKGHTKENTTNNNTLVIPILGGLSVQSNSGDQETSSTQQEN